MCKLKLLKLHLILSFHTKIVQGVSPETFVTILQKQVNLFFKKTFLI